jgi:hypothetical protein
MLYYWFMIFSQNRDVDELSPANSDNRDWEYFDIPKEFV